MIFSKLIALVCNSRVGVAARGAANRRAQIAGRESALSRRSIVGVLFALGAVLAGPAQGQGQLMLPVVDDQTFLEDGRAIAIAPLNLGAATGGTGTYNYTLAPDLPNGLSFDANATPSPSITGTPQSLTATTNYTYTVASGTFTPAISQFNITVSAPPALSFGSASIANQTYTQNMAITSMALPEVMPRTGYGDVSYTLNNRPAGLNFNASTRVLSGTPTAVGSTSVAYIATDGATPTRATQTLGFTIAVVAAPQSFMLSSPTPPTRCFTTGVRSEWVLPAATGGTGTGSIRYELNPTDPPAGLTLSQGNATTPPSVSGTPTGMPSVGTFAYTATRGGEMATAPQPLVIRTDNCFSANEVSQVILPEMARAMLDASVSAIAQRVESAGVVHEESKLAGFSLRGSDAAGAADWMRRNGQLLADSEWKKLLGGSEFVTQLNVNGDGADGGIGGRTSFWGRGEYRNVSGASDSLDWDGTTSGAHLGVDVQSRGGNRVVGLAVSWLDGDVSFEDEKAGGNGKGDYSTSMRTFSPYLGWSTARGFRGYITGAWGSGDISIEPDNAAEIKRDADLRGFALGGSGQMWDNGVTFVRLKAEVASGDMEVEKDTSSTVMIEDVAARRIRLALEGKQARLLDSGGLYESALEAGIRSDGGDGETGSGIEIGGNLAYTAARVSVDGGARMLVGHSGDTKEWGVNGSLRLSPGVDGQGFALAVKPGYGAQDGGVEALWRRGLPVDSDDADYDMRVDSRVGYGLQLRGRDALLTPFGEVSNGGVDRRRVGLQWREALGGSSMLDLSLVGEQGKSDAVLLKGEVGF